MLYGMYLSTAGAMVEEVRQDVIANNLANSSTTGYRADVAVFRARLNEYLEEPPVQETMDPLLGSLGGGVFLDEVAYSEKNGPLQPSSSPLDLALEGDGYFVVSDGGQNHYTRDGRFRRSEDGALTSLDGRFQVLDEKGRPIRLPEGEVRIDQSGEIMADGRALGRLWIVGSDDPVLFEKTGSNLYRFAGQGAPAKASPLVRQFFLEGSNVQPIQEMVRLIESHRAYETSMQMIRIQDQTLDQSVNRMARITG